MSFQFASDAAAFIATSRDILQSYGLEVRTGSDFEEYREIVTKHRPMQILGSPFNPDNHKLKDANAFWLTGWTEDGQLIHTQAAKRVVLNGRPLANYLLRNFQLFPPPFPDIDLSRSRFRATPGAHRIAGSVVYHGEVWMAPERGLYRGIGLSTVMARTGLLEILRRWDPDWIYGFMLRQVAFKGFAERMGYMHNEPGALLWYRDGRDEATEAFLTYLSRDDAVFMLDMPVGELVEAA